MFVADENLWQLGLNRRIMGDKGQEGDVSLRITWIRWFLSMCFSVGERMLGDYKTLALTIIVGNRGLVHVNEKIVFSLFACSFPGTLGPLQIRKNLSWFSGSGWGSGAWSGARLINI